MAQPQLEGEPDWRALAAAFVPGDVLRFRRGAYSHLALSVGRGRVVHLWSPTSAGAFRVRLDTLRTVMKRPGGGFFEAPERATAELDARMRRDHTLEPFDGEEAARRARSRLGEALQYDCVSDNCEHFVTWARYGRRASPQVESHAGDVLSAAMLGAAVGGAAGLVVGALISLFTKADALSASVGTTAGASVGASALNTFGDDGENMSEDEGDRLSSLSDSDSEVGSGLHTTERERLWADVAANTAAARADSEQGRQSAADMTSWIEGRRHEAVAASARKYGDDRHEALASRLAEDGLQCGICYSNLLRVRAVAFPCDHFTCAVCFAAFHENASGHKSCPYCRSDIGAVDEIHKSTKLRAKLALAWE